MYELLNYFQNGGMPGLIEQSQAREAEREAVEAQTKDRLTRLSDYMSGTDTRRRIEAAKAADAELALKVNQQTLMKRSQAEAARQQALAAVAQQQQRLSEMFAEPEARAKLTQEQAQASTMQQDALLKSKYGERLSKAELDYKVAATQATQKQALVSSQRAQLAKVQASQAQDAQRVAAFNYKNQTLYNLLSRINLQDPQQIDSTLALAQRTPGITLEPSDVALIKQDPKRFMAFAQSASGAGTIPEEGKMRLASTLRREEQALKAQDAQNLAVTNAQLKPEPEFNLSTAAAKGPEWQTTVDALGRGMLGINYMDVVSDPESKQYSPEIAHVISSSARQIMDQASTGASSLKEFRLRRNAMLQTYANAYQAGLGLTQDPEKATAYMPSSVAEYQLMSKQLNDLTTDVNSPAARFVRIIAQRGPEGLTSHIASLKEQGIAYGLSPKVIDYLIYAASEKLAQQQRHPKGVM